MKHAVFLHIYYAHLFEEIVGRLKAITFPFNLYVNLVEGHTDHLDIQSHFPDAVVRVSPNQGMDPGGNLRMLEFWMQHGQNEEFLVFLHSKGKPADLGDPAKTQMTDSLRNTFWSIVTPEKATLAEQAFEDPEVGMVGVQEWHRYPGRDHGDPIPECSYYIDKLNLNNHQTKSYGFIGGTCFYVRSKIFRDVFSKVDILDIVSELPSYSNGGLIHALERIFGYVVLSSGYKIKGI